MVWKPSKKPSRKEEIDIGALGRAGRHLDNEGFYLPGGERLQVPDKK
jgi:hypothetical protein